MRHLCLCCVLTAVLTGGVSGCAALSGLGAKQEESAPRVLPPALPAPALAAVDRLTAGGELWTLTERECGGRTFYDIMARMNGKDVRYEVSSDGTVLAAGKKGESTAISSPVDEGRTMRGADES